MNEPITLDGLPGGPGPLPPEVSDEQMSDRSTDRKLIDVWGHVGLSGLVEGLDSSIAVRNMYKHYWGTRILVSIPRVIRTNGRYLTDDPQWAGATFVEIFEMARELGLRIILVPDFHVDGDGGYGEPQKYHGQPPPGRPGFAPFLPGDRETIVDALRSIITVAAPDYIQVGNEPGYHAGWPDLTEEEYVDVLRHFSEAIPTEFATKPVIISDFESAIPAARSWFPNRELIWGTHKFVFPVPTQPGQLYLTVKSYLAELRSAIPNDIAIWSDEGTGVGKLRSTPAGLTSVESELGAELTESYLAACWHSGVVPGLLQVNGVTPICGEGWNMCANLIGPDGTVTMAAQRVKQLIPVMDNEEEEDPMYSPKVRVLADIAEKLSTRTVAVLVKLAKRFRRIEKIAGDRQ